MVQTRTKLSGYLLLWLAFFLGNTLYPHARSLYEGMRNPERGWAVRFREQERLQHFLAVASPKGVGANESVLFVWGGEPELWKIEYFLGAAKYLLYPARLSVTAGSRAISRIAVYDWGAEVLHHLPFCQPAGDKHSLCKVKREEGPSPAYHLQVHYQAPEFTLLVQASELNQSDTALLIASAGRINVPLARQTASASPGGDGRFYQWRGIVAPPRDPERIQLSLKILMMDKSGLLSVSEEYRLPLMQ